MELNQSELNGTPKKQNELRNILEQVKAIADTANAADIARAAEIVAPDRGVRVETFSAVVAAVLFIKYNKNNRPLRSPHCLKYLGKMAAGEWTFTSQPLTFDTEGFAIDFQHRMVAQALSGATIKWTVHGNLPSSTVIDMDDGASRNARDALNFTGHEKNGALLARVQKLVESYSAKAERRPAEVMVSHTVKQVQNNLLSLDWAIETAERVKKASSNEFPPLTVVDSAALVCLLTSGGYQKAEAEMVLTKLQNGTGKSENSPLFLASSILQKATRKGAASIPQHERLAIAIRAARFETLGEVISGPTVLTNTKHGLPMPNRPETKGEVPEPQVPRRRQ